MNAAPPPWPPLGERRRPAPVGRRPLHLPGRLRRRARLALPAGPVRLDHPHQPAPRTPLAALGQPAVPPGRLHGDRRACRGARRSRLMDRGASGISEHVYHTDGRLGGLGGGRRHRHRAGHAVRPPAADPPDPARHRPQRQGPLPAAVRHGPARHHRHRRHNVFGAGYDYRATVSVWFRGLFVLQPHPEAIAGAPLLFQLHALTACLLFAAWPFTRLVHVWSAPIGYLARPVPGLPQAAAPAPAPTAAGRTRSASGSRRADEPRTRARAGSTTARAPDCGRRAAERA